VFAKRTLCFAFDTGRPATFAAPRPGTTLAATLYDLPQRFQITSHGGSMSNQQLRRACVRVLMSHLTRGEGGRPVALGCKLERAEMTMAEVTAVWARLGVELRRQGLTAVDLLPDDWGPLRELLTEYRAVMRERFDTDRKRANTRPCVLRAPERRVHG
jgi:hypothetical protein